MNKNSTTGLEVLKKIVFLSVLAKKADDCSAECELEEAIMSALPEIAKAEGYIHKSEIKELLRRNNEIFNTKIFLHYIQGR